MSEDEATLAAALATGAARRDGTTFRPTMLDGSSAEGRAEIARLARDERVVVIDTIDEQLEEIARSRAPGADLTAAQARERAVALRDGASSTRFGAWAFYSWSSRLVHVLPAALHRELRLDRNRYKITPKEQSRLGALRIAIVGLSVGRAVLSTILREGIGGEVRLADFDTLSLSNLNRLTGGVVDLGVNKAVLAARELTELDPYLDVVVFSDGVRDETMDALLDGLDVLVDECDDLAMKVALREKARARGIPVVMATSDRGLLDVERFDREPTRALFHGILADVRTESLRGLTTKQKVPYVLRIIDAERLEPRMAASLVEVKETLSTWPQLASGVAIGGAMVSNVVRRIALGELDVSGRWEVDLDRIVREGVEVPLPAPRPWAPEAAATTAPELAFPTASSASAPTADEVRFVVRCATLAPSGGNIQPWRFHSEGNVLRCALDVDRSRSLLNYEDRGSFLAHGAALEAAIIGASALGFTARVGAASESWTWEVTLERTGVAAKTRDLDLLRERCCHRKNGPSLAIADDDLAALAAAASPLEVVALSDPSSLAALGDALGELDRVRFLSPRFHHELFSEIRWTREEALAGRDGIDVASLELDAADLAVLEVLRSAAAMEVLTQLGLGRALGNASRTAFRHTPAALVLGARAVDRASLVECGRGLLRLWLEATARGLGVHPWGSPFLFQRLGDAADATLSPWERDAVMKASTAFAKDTTTMLVLRLSRGTGYTARSVRRDVDDVLTFAR